MMWTRRVGIIKRTAVTIGWILPSMGFLLMSRGRGVRLFKRRRPRKSRLGWSEKILIDTTFSFNIVGKGRRGRYTILNPYYENIRRKINRGVRAILCSWIGVAVGASIWRFLSQTAYL